jgi:hypothetical protein
MIRRRDAIVFALINSDEELHYPYAEIFLKFSTILNENYWRGMNFFRSEAEKHLTIDFRWPRESRQPERIEN